MKKVHPSLLLAAAIALCATSAHSQGTMLYTWHSYQPGTQLFQASFQIYDWQMAPGSMLYGSALFQQTVSVTSPDHNWLPGTGVDRGSRVLTDGSLYLNVAFTDPLLAGTTLYLTAGGIHEVGRAGPVYSESGFWTYAPVPEPSSAALLALGLLALLRKRAVSLP